MELCPFENLVYKSCLLNNSETLLDIFTKLFTNIKHSGKLKSGIPDHPEHSHTCMIQVLPFLKNTKDLNPSYKMDLDFWVCFGRKKLCLITKNTVVVPVH